MLFKVISVNKDGKECVDYYDNITQKIYDECGKVYEFKKMPAFAGLITDIENRQEKVSKTADRIRELRIQLGLKCNFHCKYCNQAPNRHSFEAAMASAPVHLPPKITAINLCDMLVKNNVKLRPKTQFDCPKIVFWGGEPFVYFKYIKELMPRLRKLYPHAIFSTITNGSLLTDEIVDFCIENRLSLTISHDGPSFNTYRDDKDPLNDPKIVSCIEKYIEYTEQDQKKAYENPDTYEFNAPLYFAFNVVVTPENCNLDEIYHYLESRFKNRITFHYESIVKCDEASSKIVNQFTKDQADFLQNQIFKFGLTNDQNSYTNPQYSIRQGVSRILINIVNEVNAKTRPYPCDVASDTRLAIDLSGNILACHGADAVNFKIGHLNSIGSETTNKCISWESRSECKECPYVLHCGGGCAIASNKDQEIMCKNLKIWYGGFFAAAWYHLLNRIIRRIETCKE